MDRNRGTLAVTAVLSTGTLAAAPRLVAGQEQRVTVTEFLGWDATRQRESLERYARQVIQTARTATTDRTGRPLSAAERDGYRWMASVIHVLFLPDATAPGTELDDDAEVRRRTAQSRTRIAAGDDEPEGHAEVQRWVHLAAGMDPNLSVSSVLLRTSRERAGSLARLVGGAVVVATDVRQRPEIAYQLYWETGRRAHATLDRRRAESQARIAAYWADMRASSTRLSDGRRVFIDPGEGPQIVPDEPPRSFPPFLTGEPLRFVWPGRAQVGTHRRRTTRSTGRLSDARTRRRKGRRGRRRR